MKKKGIILTVAIILLLSAIIGSNSNDSASDDVSNESPTPSENILQETKEANIDINFDQIIEETRSELTNSEFYDYVTDVAIVIDEDAKDINLLASVKDGTRKELALSLADTLVRKFSFNCSFYNEELNSPSTEYYGGIFDLYNFYVGVTSDSEIKNPDNWYVYQYVSAGKYKVIELQQ